MACSFLPNLVLMFFLYLPSVWYNIGLSSNLVPEKSICVREPGEMEHKTEDGGTFGF